MGEYGGWICDSCGKKEGGCLPIYWPKFVVTGNIDGTNHPHMQVFAFCYDCSRGDKMRFKVEYGQLKVFSLKKKPEVPPSPAKPAKLEEGD